MLSLPSSKLSLSVAMAFRTLPATPWPLTAGEELLPSSLDPISKQLVTGKKPKMHVGQHEVELRLCDSLLEAAH